VTEQVWMPCFAWEKRYQVSSIGNVLSFRGSIEKNLKARPLKSCLVNGYPFVMLQGDGKKRSIYVHRLMLEAFTRSNPKGMEAAHRNGIQTDNRIENLYWATRLENEADKTRHGGRPVGENNVKARLTEAEVRLIHKLAHEGTKISALARQFKISHHHADCIMRETTWKHLWR
jgi:hypothetical protein